MGCKPSKVSVAERYETEPYNKSRIKKQLKGRNKVFPLEYLEQYVEQDDYEKFPDPNSIEVLEYTPPDNSKRKSYKIEDTFWKRKRKLIPDYSALLKIDEHALKAPKYLKNNPDDLIEYLIKVAKTDFEKVRVLIRWIGDNIEYDKEGLNPRNADCSVLLRTGKAICAGYANLVLMFCEKANIECKKLRGQTKNGEFEKTIRVIAESDHCWNQVKIDGAWYFVDATWCVGSGKTFIEEWFIVDPKAFIYTHLPMKDNGEISAHFQHMTEPFTSSEEWDKLVYRSPFGCAFGFEPINCPKKNLQITDSKLTLKYKYNGKLALDHHVSIHNKHGNIQNDDWRRMVFEKNGVVTANIRFPRPDVYYVGVHAQCKFKGDNNKTSITCFQYIVNNTGKGVDPFPGENAYGWGEKDDFVNSGFKIIQPVSPVVEAENGVAKVKVKLPSNGIVPITFSFLQYKSRNLDQYVYAEKNGTIATYYIQCPEAGEYRFTIGIKVTKGKHYIEGANFLVTSNKKNGDHLFLISSYTKGPKPRFYQLGFTTNNHSTTIFFHGDRAILHIKKTKRTYIIGELISDVDPNADDYMGTYEDKTQCVFTVKKPRIPGIYSIQLYGREKKLGGNEHIGRYCVPYMVPFIQKYTFVDVM